MTSGDTVQCGKEHKQFHVIEASEERPTRKAVISANASAIPVAEVSQTQEPKVPAEVLSHSEGYVDVGGELLLQEPRESGNAKRTESEIQKTAQAHVPPEVDSYVDTIEESDGYQSVNLVVDSDDSKNDSSLGESLRSSTSSMRSSLYESVQENGRTYHIYKQGSYYLPNDAVEQERLDLQHHLFVETLSGKLNLAPVHSPHNVLDIGTGTGIWAMDFAMQNPSAVVIGTDLSAMQPQYVPPNCQFEVDDAEDVWVYSRRFDYIHGRALFSCFKDPAAVFKKAYDNLTPGGYFEMQDVYFKPHSNDGTVDGTAFARWNEMVVEGAKKLNRDWHCVQHYKWWFEEIGFEDVIERHFYWPLNPWAKGKRMKMIGLWSMQNALEGVNSISLAIMTRVLGKSPDEVEAELEEVRDNIKDSSIHSYWPVYVVYGRKPL